MGSSQPSPKAGRLAGKTAIVTGASSGLGREIAKAYALEGAQVCCVDLYPNIRNALNPNTGKADDYNNRIATATPTHELLTETYGGKHIFVRTDITKAEDVENAVQSCVQQFGRLDIIVNNAGISVESTHPRLMRVHETTEEDFDRTIAINTKGIFLGCKYAIQQMLKQESLPGKNGDKGWIINTSSIQGLIAYYGCPSYAASKGAAVNLTRQIAIDYGRDRIHCNALCPGCFHALAMASSVSEVSTYLTTTTDLRTAMTANIQNDPNLLKTIDSMHPFGGFGSAEDVARVAVFFASDDAAWVTGVPMPVDGGFTAL